MARCDSIPPPAKACSGKCKGGGCVADVWVLAACEGMAALFTKQENGQLTRLEEEGCGDASLLDGVREKLSRAAAGGVFRQLVLVGSANDIAWTQASLPPVVAKQVVAEIEYPLMAGWFGPMDKARLAQAMEHVFAA